MSGSLSSRSTRRDGRRGAGTWWRRSFVLAFVLSFILSFVLPFVLPFILLLVHVGVQMQGKIRAKNMKR